MAVRKQVDKQAKKPTNTRRVEQKAPSLNRQEWNEVRELAATIRRNKSYKPADTRIPMISEQGSSGLNIAGGFVSEAYNPSLYWPGVRDTYKKIMTSTPEIVMVGRAFEAWARNINPEVDLPENPSDDDKRYQEFLYQDFENMEGGFGQFCESLVGNVPFYGWGWWEVVPGLRDENWTPPPASVPGVPNTVQERTVRFVTDANGESGMEETLVDVPNPSLEDNWRSQYNDGLIGIRRLAWRDPGTFSRWATNAAKRLTGMWQKDDNGPEVFLPLDDHRTGHSSLHMTFGDPNNPEGRSPLEAVWRLERLKYGLEVVQGIGFEHAAGFLSVTKTIDGVLTSDDKANIRDAAYTILSAHEGNYAYWPFGLEGKVSDVPFTAASAILEAIKYYGILMLSVYTMEWIGLNTMTQFGAKAAQADVTQAAVFTFNSMMDGFAAQYDAQVGRHLYEWNKGSFPDLTRRPKIKFSNVTNKVALAELGSFWKAIDGILPTGPEDWKAFRKATGFLPMNPPNPEDVAGGFQDNPPLQVDEPPANETVAPGNAGTSAPPETAKQASKAASIAHTTRMVVKAAEVILANATVGTGNGNGHSRR